MKLHNNISDQQLGGLSSKNDRLQGISKQIEDMIKKNPSLHYAVDKVRNDPKSMKRLAILPKLAERANKSLGCNVTEFDLIEHSLIAKKDERITKASTFLNSIGYAEGFAYDKKALATLFINGPDADIGSKYQELGSGARPLVSALIYGGFLAYEKSDMPGAIHRFLKDFKNAPIHGQYKTRGAIGELLLGAGLLKSSSDLSVIMLGAVILLMGVSNIVNNIREKKKASTFTQATISNDLVKVLSKNTVENI